MAAPIESNAGAGSRIAHYEVQREVGRGGMGEVRASLQTLRRVSGDRRTGRR